MRRRAAIRGLAASGLATACLLSLGAGSASATFHLMMIREVYAGAPAQPESQYVELQMWSGGQNLVQGHVLRAYGPTGALTGVDTFPADVPNGANNSTLLLATPPAEAQFGVVGDAPLSPANQLSPAGGAVCWETIDCVSWGAFSGTLPSPAGPPAAPGGIPEGMALRRTISPNCPTLLEAADDRDSSALDFQVVFPFPRPNSLAPTERPCGPPAGGGSGGTQGGTYGSAPQTRIVRGPGHRTRDRTPTFRFAASPPAPTFRCRIDRAAFRHCRSPFTSRRLRPGRHTFGVKALAADGTADSTPAAYRFSVR